MVTESSGFVELVVSHRAHNLQRSGTPQCRVEATGIMSHTWDSSASSRSDWGDPTNVGVFMYIDTIT